jgi:putative transposase
MEDKIDIIKFVEEQKKYGRTLSVTLANLNISRSTFYSWKKQQDRVKEYDKKKTTYPLTEKEKELILDKKNTYPNCRHRQIQGLLQIEGTYISASSVYKVLKENNLVEEFERRESPQKSPQYEVRARNLMWGLDWTKIYVDHQRFHLITLIDFFSRMLLAFDIVPNVSTDDVTCTYENAIEFAEIDTEKDVLPELRTDRGSPNTSIITKQFFELMGADLSLARVRRPTDNAITERFYGTIKQEEMYLAVSYPDIQSAKEEIGNYIDYYNYERPHSSLYNFTPFYVYELNNKSELLAALNEMKFKSRQLRRENWLLKRELEMQLKLYPELARRVRPGGEHSGLNSIRKIDNNCLENYENHSH